MRNDKVGKVFFDGKHFQRGLSFKEVCLQKQIYREFALEILELTGADHVMYSHSEYDDDGKLSVIRFYSGLAYTDEEFHKWTSKLEGDYAIGAVHK